MKELVESKRPKYKPPDRVIWYALDVYTQKRLTLKQKKWYPDDPLIPPLPTGQKVTKCLKEESLDEVARIMVGSRDVGR